jgi:hypothetical protein
MDIDFGKTYLLIENPTTITLSSKTGDGQYTDHTVRYVAPTKLTHEDVVHSGALLDGTWSAWHVWREPLDAAHIGLTPKLGDKVRDPRFASGAACTVKQVDHVVRQKRYRLLARKDVA